MSSHSIRTNNKRTFWDTMQDNNSGRRRHYNSIITKEQNTVEEDCYPFSNNFLLWSSNHNDSSSSSSSSSSSLSTISETEAVIDYFDEEEQSSDSTIIPFLPADDDEFLRFETNQYTRKRRKLQNSALSTNLRLDEHPHSISAKQNDYSRRKQRTHSHSKHSFVNSCCPELVEMIF